MAVTESSMLELGTHLPKFYLPAVNGTPINSETLDAKKGVLVAIICNHCPFVIHLKKQFVMLANQWVSEGLCVLAISANDPVMVAEDSPEAMAEFASKNGFEFPYLFDESQLIVQKMRAVCTPEFYLYNKDCELVYRGQFDGSRPGKVMDVTGDSLAAAVNSVLSDQEVEVVQKPSSGCNIKWKEGNWPDYC